jgi:hypothetical protein
MSNPIIDALPWADPKIIETRKGPRAVKAAPPNDQFWEIYRDNKEAMQNAGFSVSRFGGEWKVNWWAKPAGHYAYPEIAEKVARPAAPLPEVLGLTSLVYETEIKDNFRFQIPLIQQTVASMNRFGSALNGCGTGVGKTFITLFAAKERHRRILVICPKTIVNDWQRGAFLVGVEVAGIFGWEWLKTGKTPFGHWTYKVLNAGKKNERKVKDAWVWTVPEDVDIVFDEVHRASGMDTQNSDVVVAAKEAGVQMYMLSATVANDPTKMRAVGYALGLHKGHKDYYDWMKEHGVRQETINAGGRKIQIWKFRGGANHLQIIHREIFPTKGCRVRADQLGAAFPHTQILAKAYDMEEAGDIRRAYEEMMARVDEIMASKDMASSERQACILVEILRARQRVELLKIPLFVSLTRDYMEEGNSVFIAVNFLETLEELCKQLNITAFICGLSSGKKIMPGYNEHKRIDAVDEFQANKTNVIAGIIKACREGLNLHDIHGGHPRVSLISPSPSAFDLKQVLGRVARAGGLSPSLQRIVFAGDTIEEEVCENLADKLDQLDLIMDGHLQKGIFPPSYSAYRQDTESEDDNA